MKTILIALFVLTVSIKVLGQTTPLVGQYFQNLPAFAPALTGANDYLDIRLSSRQQWAGFEDAPQTHFLSAYSSLNKKEANQNKTHSLPVANSNLGNLKNRLRHGVGGYFQTDNAGAFSKTNFNLNYAIHVPVFRKTFLSFGVTTGITNSKIDVNDVTVKNQANDQTYLSYLENGGSNFNYNLAAGMALYSDRYYFSYSMRNMVQALISGNETFNSSNESRSHQFMVGSRHYLNQNVELIPNAFLRLENTMPALIDFGLRMRYQQKYWTGISYRNSGTVIGMLGMAFNDLLLLSYSYEYGTGELGSYTNGTHEIVLGLQLFNNKRFTSMW